MEDNKNIDDLIRELQDEDIDQESEETNKALSNATGTSDIDKTAPKEVDVTEQDELMKAVFDMTIEDRKKADNAYEIFAPEIAQGKDRSSASKEAMMKAIELKIASAKNIIDMMKLNKKDKPSVGVFMGDLMGGKKAGIDLKTISEELGDE